MRVLRQSFHSRFLYALACASEAASPFLKMYARVRAPAAPSPPSRWKTALLLGADHIGDILYLTPSLHALKHAFPECTWLFPVSGPAFGVLENNPYVRPIKILGSSGRKRASAIRSALAVKQPDAIVCYNSGRYWPDLLTAFEQGISNRVGYVHKGFSAWVTHPIDIRFPQPYPAYFRDLVAQLTGLKGDWSLRPVVYPTDQDRADASATWIRLGFENKPVVACFPFTRQPTTTWSAQNFASALRMATLATGSQPLLCGGPEDVSRLTALADEIGLKCSILAGDLNLRALAVFLGNCRLVFSNDSGPRHLANAAGVPVAFMRNLWPFKVATGAYLDTEVDLAPPDEECLSGKALQNALALLKPEQVAERLVALINAPKQQANLV